MGGYGIIVCMHRVEIEGLAFYRSDLLNNFPNVIHAVTTRHGGSSPTPFDSLNLSAHVGDDAANVNSNLDRVHQALGLDRHSTVDASQAQAERVAVITQSERGTRVAGVDGLISNNPGIPLMLRFADCVPILFYDPVQQAVGLAHAGWRGTVGKVVTNTVIAMRDAFGTDPADLISVIGPSIGPCCYEIGSDVHGRVNSAFPDTAQLLLQQNGALHLDLWQANAHQLRELGLKQIEIANICTADHTNDFYSWRRETAQTGRFGALISLKQS